MFWHILHFVALSIFIWYLFDALTGLRDLGRGALRIAQALEDLVDLQTPDEGDEQPAVATADDPDAFVQALLAQLNQTYPTTPPPIPEDA